MASPDAPEHFVTLFDSKFLPMGLALHRSLAERATPFHLWILCMDELAERQLKRLDLPHATLLSLGEVETAALRAVKPSRSAGEYCWTMTPFLPQFVLDRDPAIGRVTYVDADLFFLDDPRDLLAELEASGKHVLITEHAFAPEYRKGNRYGRFCVQFNTFRNTSEARQVLAWWQARCLEWCYARYEDGRFGDQTYLDQWPGLFGDAVHVLGQTERTVAPWNVRHLDRRSGGATRPVFFHFHGLRIVAPGRVLLYRGYRIGAPALRFYALYMEALRDALRRMAALGMPVPSASLAERWPLLRRIKREVFRQVRYEAI